MFYNNPVTNRHTLSKVIIWSVFVLLFECKFPYGNVNYVMWFYLGSFC